MEKLNNLNLALYNLTKRVDQIDSLDYKFWIPTVIAVISILSSAFLLFVQNRRSMFATIEQNIDKARLTLNEKAITLTSSNNINTNMQKLIIDTYLEHLLNKYDGACEKFNKHKICRREFKQKYHNSIVQIVEQYKSEFGAATAYNNILLYYKKQHLHV